MNVKPEDLAANHRRALETRLLESLKNDPWHPDRDVHTFARAVAGILSEHAERQDALEARLPEQLVAHATPQRGCAECGSKLFESCHYCDKQGCTDHNPHEIPVVNFVCFCGARKQVVARPR